MKALMQDNLKRLHKLYAKYDFIILPLLILIVLRIPSLFERFWYPDEGYYAAVAKGLLQRKILYINIWDHKPPFMYYFFYVLELVNNISITLILAKVINIFSAICSFFLIYKIFEIFKVKRKAIFISLLLFSLIIGGPLIEGNIANAENFFITVNLFLFYRLLKDKWDVWNGILIFISFMIKPHGFIEAGFIVLFFLIISFRKNPKVNKKGILKVLCGFIIPLIIFFLILIIQGSLSQFFISLISDNVIYSNVQPKLFIGNIILDRRLLITFFFFIIFFGLIYLYYSKRINKEYFLVFSIININIALVTFTGRPNVHYLLQLLPATILLLGLLLNNISLNEINKLKLYHLSSLLLFSFAISLFFIFFTESDLISLTVHPVTLFVDPISYYPSFIDEVITGNNTFAPNAQDKVNNDIELGNYLDKNYSGKKYYLFTTNPWEFCLNNLEFTNKYVSWYELIYDRKRLDIEVEAIKKSDIFIIDYLNNDSPSFSVILRYFKKHINLKKLEDLKAFSIYQNMNRVD